MAKTDAYVYAVLKEFLSSNKLANAHLKKLTTLLSNHSRDRFGKERALALKKSASESIRSESFALEFDLLLSLHLCVST